MEDEAVDEADAADSNKKEIIDLPTTISFLKYPLKLCSVNVTNSPRIDESNLSHEYNNSKFQKEIIYDSESTEFAEGGLPDILSVKYVGKGFQVVFKDDTNCIIFLKVIMTSNTFHFLNIKYFVSKNTYKEMKKGPNKYATIMDHNINLLKLSTCMFC